MTVAGMVVEFILIVFITLASHYVGYRRGVRDKKKVGAICPCGHSIGSHLNGGRCQEEIKRPHYNYYGSRNGYKWVRCSCNKYWGPQPITDFFHPGTMIVERSDG